MRVFRSPASEHERLVQVGSLLEWRFRTPSKRASMRVIDDYPKILNTIASQGEEQLPVETTAPSPRYHRACEGRSIGD